MDLNILKTIGLTEGEIKIYQALLTLGKARIFTIMKKSKISSSKVYLILDKLIQRGMVSFVIEDNNKIYQTTNPKVVLDLAEQKKQEFDHFKEDFSELIPKINSNRNSIEEESAQVYKGIKGIRAAYENLLGELNPGEEYLFFSIDKEQLTLGGGEFFQNYHLKRVERKIRVRGIIESSLKRYYKKNNNIEKLSKLKFHNLTMPAGIAIGKTRVIIVIFGEINLAYELISKRLTKKYQDFFEKVWKKAKQ